MTKFASADDDGYDAILGEIRRWTKEVRTLAGKELLVPADTLILL